MDDEARTLGMLCHIVCRAVREGVGQTALGRTDAHDQNVDRVFLRPLHQPSSGRLRLQNKRTTSESASESSSESASESASG